MSIASKHLGILERVDLRTVWNNEATEFTPWLALAENLELLGKAIGIELELEEQEKNVGPYRADILCRDADSDGDTWVLIENQLEKTDHKHLGQLLTYAAGLNAVTVCWVADHFTDEHRAVLDWLNEITDERFAFFGLEVELWKIGDSTIAPKFNLASKPNTWSKKFVRPPGGGGDTENQKNKLEFWNEFLAFLEGKHHSMSKGKIFPKGINYSVGKAGFRIQTRVYAKARKLQVGIRLAGPKGPMRFQTLLARREEIDKQFGKQPIWTTDKDGNTRHVVLERPIDDLLDRETWPESHAWTSDRLREFHAAFIPLLQNIDEVGFEEEEAEAEDD